MKALSLVLGLALALGACCGNDGKDRDDDGKQAQAVSEAKKTNDGRHELAADGQKLGMTLTDLGPDVTKELRLKIRAGSTVNVDAGGLEPVALKALAAGHAERAKAAGGGEGVVICASEEGAAFSFDGYLPAIPIAGTKDEVGWVGAAKRLAPGVHTIKVLKEHYFPVETQVVVRPGVYEVLAVRLGRAGMTDFGGPKKQ